MPIGEYPILEVIVRQLAGQGFDHITLAVNHQANLIKAFFADGSEWGVRIDYSMEPQPLSTVAPLLLVDDLPDSFLLMNGDVLTDLRFDSLLDKHVASGARFTIAAARRSQKIDYGVLRAGGDGRLTGFEEKPSIECLVSMGIYGVDRDVLTLVPEGRPYGFDDLMIALLERGDDVRVSPYDGYWADIGRPEDYMEAIDAFESMKSALLPHG
jgi:NDP-mannose synthase